MKTGWGDPMKKFLVLAIAAGACLMMAGCATNVGTQTINDFGRYQQTQPGVTTKRELHGIFGQPHEVRAIEQTGESVWSYYQIRSQMNAMTLVPFVGMVAGGDDRDITRADFYFDPNGVLLRSQREERTRYVNSWLQLGDALTPSGQVAAVEAEMTALALPFDREEAERMAGYADLSQ
jgi:hypothetical protein